MNLFGRKQAPFTTPTVSTEQPEQQLGFWQKNRTSVYLFGGCILLLIVARSCNSHEQQAQKTQRAEHVKQDVEREQSDKDGQIADLHSQLFNAQRSVAAAKAAAETASPLTPQQMQQLALAGGTLPPAMFPSNNATTPPGTGGVDAAAAVQAQRLPGSYNAGEFSNGSPHAPDKPVTLVISYRQEDVSGSSKEQVATAAQPPPAGSPVAQAPGSGIPAAASGADGPSVRPDTGASAANHNPTFAPKVANPEDQQHQLAAGTGEKYRIREGTWLPCTEQLRINGFFAGNINCLISIPIYSTSGAHLLIPQGNSGAGARGRRERAKPAATLRGLRRIDHAGRLYRQLRQRGGPGSDRTDRDCATKWITTTFRCSASAWAWRRSGGSHRSGITATARLRPVANTARG